MANVGRAPQGRVLTARGNLIPPSFQDIGTNSGLTNNGVILAQGNSAFIAAAPSTAGFVLTSNGAGSPPTFQASSSSGAITNITGNSGGVQAPSGGNFNVLGTGSITSVGTPSTETIQLTGMTNHAVLVGAGTATITKVGPSASTGQILQNNASADPSYSTATYPSSTTINQLLFSSSANVVGGLTAANSAALVSTSTGVPIWSGTMTNGQVILGSTGATPAAGTITSSDSSITVSLGAGTLSLQVASGTAVVKTITGNTGGALSPTSGNFNIVGTGSITVAGSGSTETVQLTGMTNHAIQIGAGTATLTQLAATATTGQILQNNASADPSWSTATYPSTTTINQVLYSSANNVVAGITAANNGTMISGATGIPSWLANGTTGQVLTATTGSPASWATPAAANAFETVTGQRFTSSGAFTYTPTTGMRFVIVELVGGGGGSGGVAATTAQAAGSGAGGGGAYARFVLTAAQVGASLSGSVGAAGAAGTAGANAGGNGGNTTLATTAAWTVGGGLLGGGGAAGVGVNTIGGAGGTVTTGTGTILFTATGAQAGYAIGNNATFVVGAAGGNSILGAGGMQSGQAGAGNTFTVGTPGFSPGGGASSTSAYGTNSAQVGAVGAVGIAIFTEFLNV